MLLKAYNAKQIQDLLFDIKKDYPNKKVLDFAEASEDSLIKNLSPSLFSNKEEVLIAIGLETYDSNFLLKLIDKLVIKCVWGFVGLNKNTNLFKKLKTSYLITDCEVLDSEEKKINKLKQNVKGLTEEQYKILASALPASKSALEKETNKLNLLTESDFKAYFSNPVIYAEDSFIFSFIEKLFTETDKFFLYSSLYKIINSCHPNVFKLLLSKKICSLICLKKKNLHAANLFWKYYPQQLDKVNIHLKKFSYDQLFMLLFQCENNFEWINDPEIYFLNLTKLLVSL